jgi:hypothetical protein
MRKAKNLSRAILSGSPERGESFARAGKPHLGAAVIRRMAARASDPLTR